VTSHQTAIRVRALLFIAVCLQGCSLVSLKSPEQPLPRRDLNARMLTREYAARFSSAVAQAADDIAANTSDAARQEAAVRWKLSAVVASRRAATQMAPMMALLDCWALSAQMHEFFETGAGATLFGDQQDIAREAAAALQQDATRLAAGLTSKTEFTSYAQFVAGYVREHPLRDIGFVRTSVLDLWVSQTHQQVTLLSTLGTVPEAMNDFADRTRLYSEQLPEETGWRAQLAMRGAGYGPAEVREALSRLDSRLADIARLADSSPELLHGAVADLRANLFEVATRFDRSWLLLVRSLHDERAALSAEVKDERIALTAAADVERAEIMKDADHTATQLTEAAWGHLRAELRELAIFGLVAVVLVLSMPFAAGYYLGRARARPSA
jgi:hypothetical protein